MKLIKCIKKNNTTKHRIWNTEQIRKKGTTAGVGFNPERLVALGQWGPQLLEVLAELSTAMELSVLSPCKHNTASSRTS